MYCRRREPYKIMAHFRRHPVSLFCKAIIDVLRLVFALFCNELAVAAIIVLNMYLLTFPRSLVLTRLSWLQVIP